VGAVLHWQIKGASYPYLHAFCSLQCTTLITVICCTCHSNALHLVPSAPHSCASLSTQVVTPRDAQQSAGIDAASALLQHQEPETMHVAETWQAGETERIAGPLHTGDTGRNAEPLHAGNVNHIGGPVAVGTQEVGGVRCGLWAAWHSDGMQL